jgi:L-seryl-tRNA(Ser) seleniumtransferase
MPRRTIENVNAAGKLRELPAVHEVLGRLAYALDRYPRALVVEEVRRALDHARRAILSEAEAVADLEEQITRALGLWDAPSLRHVINATGVVLHTNLGRAPIGAFTALPGYSNLEYDLTAGRRGKRDTHLAALIERLAGAPGIVVNNNAAAVFLALNELAASGEAIVSRGELIEIGDGFRIPDIMARSGALLCEVGTTNRTSIDDYRNAINERTRLLMRVHPSKFRITGFTARVEIRELAALGRERGIPVYEDLGSGCLVDLRTYGVDEPLVSESIGAGADVVSFSGDKLLGGPQAGILAGRPDLIVRLRRNPLFRALRVNKLITQSMEGTLRALLLERWEQVPAIAMIRQTAEEIGRRAEALLTRVPHLPAAVIDGESVIGGGATPDQSIPTRLIAIDCEDVVAAERTLRHANPPVVARVEEEKLILDLRTVFAGEEEQLVSALSKLR